MGKIMKNVKGMELVTSLPLSCKIYLDKFIFWFDPLSMKTVERNGKTRKIFNISRMKRASQRQHNKKFRFAFLYLQFKDLKSYLLQSIYFKFLNCKLSNIKISKYQISNIKIKLLFILFLLKLYAYINIFKLLRGNKYHFS